MTSKVRMAAAMALALAGFAGVSPLAAPSDNYGLPRATARCGYKCHRDPNGLKQRRKNNKTARKARTKNRGKSDATQ